MQLQPVWRSAHEKSPSAVSRILPRSGDFCFHSGVALNTHHARPEQSFKQKAQPPVIFSALVLGVKRLMSRTRCTFAIQRMAKKRVDPAILERRAQAMKVREEAIRIAAEKRGEAPPTQQYQPSNGTMKQQTSSQENLLQPTKARVKNAGRNKKQAVAKLNQRCEELEQNNRILLKQVEEAQVQNTRLTKCLRQSLKYMKVVDLKDALKDAGLDVIGKKFELQSRLLASFETRS